MRQQKSHKDIANKKHKHNKLLLKKLNMFKKVQAKEILSL